MFNHLNIISLAALGYIDLMTFKIPNVILMGWVLTIVCNSLISTIPISIASLISALCTAGMYIPLRQVVRSSAGDFKLFAVIMLAIGPQKTLTVCLISMLLSLIPLACGVKKVPLGFVTFLAYTAFLLLK